MVDIVIFSKNRPMQLELLLHSLRERFEPFANIHVLYTTSTYQMRFGYKTLRDEYNNIEFVEEINGFKESFNNILRKLNERYCLFLCDDNVFVRELRVHELEDAVEHFEAVPEIHAVSLRMNPEIDYCFPAKKTMKVPKMFFFPHGFVWSWMEEGIDRHTCWGYPMAINTHIYKAREIIPIIQRLDFHNVNSLEARVNRNRMNKNLMLAMCETKIFDVCNTYSKDGQVDKESLEEFLSGKRLSMDFEFPDNMAHGIVNFSYRSK